MDLNLKVTVALFPFQNDNLKQQLIRLVAQCYNIELCSSNDSYSHEYKMMIIGGYM